MSTVEAAGKTIRSTIPARLDRLSWSPFHTRMVAGLGAAWILDGLQITIASSVTGVLVQPDTLDMTSSQVGMIASIYLVGQVVGALVLRKEVRPAGTEAAADHHAAPVPVRHRARGVHGQRRRLGVARLVLRDAVHRGDGDRRPVRGDQLGDRRDDALEVPGPGRHLDQRQLLGRRDPRLVRLADLPERVRPERRLAARVPDGPRARDRRDHRRAHPPRKPALADDPRAHGGGREEHREHRGGGTKVGPGDRARRRLAGARARLPRSATATSCSWASSSARTPGGRCSAPR